MTINLAEITASLNPCFNGRYSLRPVDGNDITATLGLNPCFNGRYSLSKKSSGRRNEKTMS